MRWSFDAYGYPTTMKLWIRYRSGDDEVTERIISDIDLDPPTKIHAYCHFRNESRTFVLNRIEGAIDPESGEIIPDISLFLGLASQKPPQPTMPVFSEKPKPMLTEDAQHQRTVDKQSLFRRFVFPIIREAAKNKLYNLFEHQCLKCGIRGRLEIDHHIPQYLGGRLWPGNLVLLCTRCNSIKSDKHPREFYSTAQLERVNDMLKKQLDIFDFKFDWRKWDRDRKGYLLQLGVDAKLVDEVLTNSEHHFYVGPKEQGEGASIRIEIDLSSLSDNESSRNS